MQLFYYIASPRYTVAQLRFVKMFHSVLPPRSDCAGTILSSSICLPQSKQASTSCSHLATNLLSCLATLANSPPLTVDALTGVSQKFEKDSFSSVIRFNGEVALSFLFSRVLVWFTLVQLTVVAGVILALLWRHFALVPTLMSCWVALVCMEEGGLTMQI